MVSRFSLAKKSFNALWLSGALLLAGVAQAHSMHAAESSATQAKCATPQPACSPTVTVAADHQGRLWRAFVNGQTLYVQARHADGSWQHALPVNAVPEAISTHGESRVQLAFGAHNQLYLVWVTKGQAEHASHIRFARSTDGGAHFSQPLTIERDAHATMHNFPALAVNDRDQVFVAWLDMRDTAIAKAAGKPANHGVTAAVFYNWSTDGGVHFQPHDKRIKSRACLCCHMSMTLDSKGLPELLFRDVYPVSERDHTLVKFAAVDQPLAPERISFGHWQLQGCPEKGPALLQSEWQGEQRLHLLWYDRKQLFYRYQQNGKLSEVQPVGQPGSARGSFASIKGVLYLAWQRYSEGAMRVYVQVSKDGGDHWSKPKQVAATSAGSDYPELVSAGQQVWLSWLTQDKGHQLLPLNGDAP